MEKRYLLFMYSAVFLLQNLYAQEINFLNIKDLNNSVSLNEKIDELNKSLNSSDESEKMAANVYITALADVYYIIKDKQLINKEITIEGLDAVEDFIQKRHSDKQLEEIINYKNKVMRNIENAISLTIEKLSSKRSFFAKALSIFSQSPILDDMGKDIINNYLNLAYDTIESYTELIADSSQVDVLENELVDSINKIKAYYQETKELLNNEKPEENIGTKLMIELSKPENSLIRLVQIGFYTYINNKIKESLEGNDVAQAKRMIAIYEDFNEKIKLTDTEINNVLEDLKNEDVDLESVIKSTGSLAEKSESLEEPEEEQREAKEVEEPEEEEPAYGSNLEDARTELFDLTHSLISLDAQSSNLNE